MGLQCGILIIILIFIIYIFIVNKQCKIQQEFLINYHKLISISSTHMKLTHKNVFIYEEGKPFFQTHVLQYDLVVIIICH